MTRGKPGGSEETRVELLDAGLRILMRDGLPSGFNLKLTDVVREVNRTTGAAYQIWPTQDDYRLDLATHVARHVSYADADVAQAALDAVLAEDADLWSVVEATSSAYLRNLVSGPEFYVALHFWATADNLPNEVASAVEEGYVTLQESFEAFFTGVFDHFDVEIVPPHSVRELTMAATAVTEGTALRHRFASTDEARSEVVELYVDILTSLLATMTTATR